MRMNGKLIIGLLLLSGCASSQTTSNTQTAPTPVAEATANTAENPEDVFYSATAGFSITKPTEWNFASLTDVAENRARVRLQDEKLAEMVQKHANAPLVVVMKHQEPHPDLNPSVQVILRPLGQLKQFPPTKIMEIAVSQIEKNMADFRFVVPIQDTTLSGHPAAHMIAQYTVQNNEGHLFPTTSRMWLVPRGDFMFMISMSGPQDGPDVSDQDFQSILASIKIDS